jgi:hypothetical protein
MDDKNNLSIGGNLENDKEQKEQSELNNAETKDKSKHFEIFSTVILMDILILLVLLIISHIVVSISNSGTETVKAVVYSTSDKGSGTLKGYTAKVYDSDNNKYYNVQISASDYQRLTKGSILTIQIKNNKAVVAKSKYNIFSIVTLTVAIAIPVTIAVSNRA